MSATSLRRCYTDDTLEGDGRCPACAKADPRHLERKERLLLAAQLRGAVRGLGHGWSWLGRCAELIEEGGR